PWLGRIAQLGDQSSLRILKRRSDSGVVLLERRALVQSSRISVGDPVRRALVVLVDGRTAPILGENNFPAVLRRVRAASRVASVAVLRQMLGWFADRGTAAVCSIDQRESGRNCGWICRCSAGRVLSGGARLSAAVV